MKFVQRKKILIAILITQLLCTTFGGHGFISIGILELVFVYSLITMDFSEFPLYWVLTAVLVVVGQVVSVVSIRKNNLQWGRWGTILLLLPVILIVFRESFDHWGKTLASSMLFLIFSIIYWYAPQFSGSSVHSDIEDVGGDEE